MAWLTGWSYRKPLTFNSNGISLSGNVTNKTVRVNMPSSDADFWTNVKADGTDVRFTDSDGETLLKFEIESFDNTGDDAWYHVKIPTITSATDTVIYIYYGKSDATSGEDITNTWDSNYRGVWHLNEDSAAGAFADSTSNNNDGTNNSTTTATGQIDKGRNVSMVTPTNISIADSNSLSFGDGATDTPITITAWVKMTDATRFRIFTKGNNAANQGEYQLIFGGDDKLSIACIDDNLGITIGKKSDNTYTADEGTFVYYAATYTGNGANTGLTLYRNGTSIAATGVDGTPGSYVAMHNTARAAYIGSYHNIGSEATGSGIIDEVTLSQVARSADWIICDYQSGLGTWLTIGAQEFLLTIAVPKVDFNFTGKVPGVYNSTNDIDIAVPKVDFNFTGKVPTVSISSPTVINVPVATFNFSRYAPTIRTADKGIAVAQVNFNFTGKVPTVSYTGNLVVPVPKATFNFTGQAPSVQLTNTEEEITWGLFDTNGDPITGAAPIIKIRSRSTGYILDWSDETFKAGGGSSPSTAMQEMDATNFQGYYRKIFTVTSWDNGWYVAATTYSAGTPKQNGSIEFKVQDGQIVDDYNSTNLDMALSTVNANVSLRLPTSSYTAPDNAGIASTLSEAQSHPTLSEMLAGGVAKESTLTAITSDITSLLNYAIAMSKWKNNKLVESADGSTVTLYDDNGVTPLLTWTYSASTKTRGKAT